jgi:hypothetical protein
MIPPAAGGARLKESRAAFQKRVRERIAAGLPEDDEGDDFQPWVWKILFEEAERLVQDAAPAPLPARLQELSEQLREAQEWVTKFLNTRDSSGLPSVEHRLGRIADELARLTARPAQEVKPE